MEGRFRRFEGKFRLLSLSRYVLCAIDRGEVAKWLFLNNAAASDYFLLADDSPEFQCAQPADSELTRPRHPTL